MSTKQLASLPHPLRRSKTRIKRCNSCRARVGNVNIASRFLSLTSRCYVMQTLHNASSNGYAGDKETPPQEEKSAKSPQSLLFFNGDNLRGSKLSMYVLYVLIKTLKFCTVNSCDRRKHLLFEKVLSRHFSYKGRMVNVEVGWCWMQGPVQEHAM